MKTINVYGKEYKVKFGYKAVAASGMMKNVMDAIDSLESTDTENSSEAINAISGLVPVISEMTLAGLQKFHKDEFGVDYEDNRDVKDKLDKVADLLDEYFDPENGEKPEYSMIELFWLFAQELIDSGFLSLSQGQTEETNPAAPQDHKKKQ